MSDNLFDAELVVARLEQVERQNRRLKQIGLLLFVLWGAVFWMGQKKPVHIQDAERFLLKDASGRNRAELGVFPGGPSLVSCRHAPHSSRHSCTNNWPLE